MSPDKAIGALEGRGASPPQNRSKAGGILRAPPEKRYFGQQKILIFKFPPQKYRNFALFAYANLRPPRILGPSTGVFRK